MLSRKMQEAINAQINAELYSAYLYLSMATWAATENLPGFANWMRVQFEEEQFHAFKFFDYVYERGGNVVLKAIDAPPTDFGSPLALFEETLAHEQKVTGLIHGLYALAVEETDYAAQSFLKWYIDEQVEEEANATAIIQQVKMIGDNKMGLMMLDREFRARTFTPPATAEAD